MIHMPRQNRLVVSVWHRERLRRAVRFPFPSAASSPISPEPTNLGRPSPRVETQSADSTTRPQTGKPRLPAPAAAANPTIVRSSSASGLTVPNNRTSRMLKKSASGVLASFRSSTGTRPPHHSAARTNVVLPICRTVRPRGYASGSSLAAALLNGLFEHPAWRSPVVPDMRTL